MPYVYILECADGSYYTGSTWDLDKRLWEHENGFVPGYTHDRRPLKLVWCDWDERIDAVFARERQLKGWSRAKKCALIEGRMDALPRLSERGPAERE